MNFSNIDIETMFKMKVLAASMGIPLNKLAEKIVDEAWEKYAEEITTKRLPYKIGKQLRKIIKEQSESD